MNSEQKRQLLIDHLGPLEDYFFTGWYRSNGKEANWRCVWLNPIHKLDHSNLPEPILRCHCSTKLKFNYLIKHKTSDRVEFVGSVCIKRFGDMTKKCIKCFKTNKCKTSRCKDCRIKCELHDEYHEDNIDHMKCQKCDYRLHYGRCIRCEVRQKNELRQKEEEEEIKQAKTFMPYGKYKGRELEWVMFNDTSYFNWFRDNVGLERCIVRYV